MESNISIGLLIDYVEMLSPDDQASLFAKTGLSGIDILHLMDPDLQDTEDQLDQFVEYRASKLLNIYVPPVLLVLGTFGHICTFLTMRTRPMIRSSSSPLLTALSGADLLVLYVGLLEQWIGSLTGFYVRNQSTLLCRLVVTLGYVCSDCSVWLMIAVTLDRALTVFRPNRRSVFRTICGNIKAFFTLFALFLAINIHFTWTVEVKEDSPVEELVPRCDASPDYAFLVTVVWPWVDAMVFCFVPFVSIAILNLIIICSILKVKSRRTRRSARHLTIMLLAVSFAFLLMSLPMNLVIIVMAAWDDGALSVADMAKCKLAFTVCKLLMYLNHSINFFVYCASGLQFRKHVVESMCRQRKQRVVLHNQHIYCSKISNNCTKTAAI